MRLIRYTYPNVRDLVPALGFSGRSPWTGLENEIGRLLSFATPVAQFPVDLQEDKDNVYVRAELPGVKREDVSVETVEDTLTITASRKEKSGDCEESFSFNRSVGLPEHVEAAKASASYENGVLTVTLPKREETKPQKIAIAVK
jgi:HSP20 family protein